MERRQWLAERPPLPRPGSADVCPPEQPVASPSPALETSLPPGSLRGRALARLTELAARLGLQAAPAAAESGRFAVRLSDADGAAMTLCLEPVRGAGRYYRRQGRLGLWYPGDNGAGGRSQPAWSGALLAAAAELLLSADLQNIADELTERAAGAAAANGSSPAGVPLPIALPAADEKTAGSDRARDEASGDPYARPYVLGPEDVETFFHVDYEYDPDAEVAQPPTCRIGIIYQCNQTCTFCQLAEMNTHIPPERIYAALDASRARGATRVIITGGEPTMCRHLVDYVRYARAHGFTTIEMQTNATLLDRRGRASALREAGLTDAQVSLHGPDGEISDRLTAAPGTHQRTLAGIDHLLDAGVRVLLNHLVFRDNCHLLLDYIDMVERRWGSRREQLILQFHAPLNEFAHPELGRRHIARYSEYAPRLLATIDRARALGYRVQDLGDPTGIPSLCVLGADSEYLGPILSQRRRPRFHRWESTWMARVEACADCELTDACMGVPKVYLALHGDAEFRPIRLHA